MTPEQWIHLTRQLPSYARVTVTGGEPLIYPGFKEVFSEIAEKHDCNIISNGLSLTKEISDFILSYPRFSVLSISVDNIGNTIRDVPYEKWKKTEEQLRYFAQRKKEVNPKSVLDIKTTVLEGNAHQLLDIHRYCVEDLKCDTHVFQFLKGSPLQHADTLFEFDEIFKRRAAPAFSSTTFEVIKDQLEQIKKYNQQNGQISFLHPKVDSLISGNSPLEINCLNEQYHIRENYQSCKYPWSSVHINVDGNLFPCLAVPIGNVQNESLTDIINGEKMRKFREIIKEKKTVEACNRCGWLKFDSDKKSREI
jgi:MoaA/NifB/PqqE/SkfB family radical SAM enzyme